MNQLQKQVAEVITDEVAAQRPGLTLSSETRLIEEDIIDSLAIIMLVDRLQERFSFSIEVEDIVAANFATVAAIASLVERARAAT